MRELTAVNGRHDPAEHSDTRLVWRTPTADVKTMEIVKNTLDGMTSLDGVGSGCVS